MNPWGRISIRYRLVILGVVLGSTLLSVSTTMAAYPGSLNGRLAYGIRVSGNVDIYSSLPNGDASRRLTTASGFDACPAYSADGKQIAYCSDASGAFEIWVMKANGTDQHQVTNLGGRMVFPDFDPVGSRIAFGGGVTDEAAGDIFSIGTDGTRLVQLTNDAADDLYPAYSPDGSQIAFISYRTGTGQVWLMNVDGSAEDQLTFDAANKDQVPDWSPDGSRLVYAGSVDFGPDDLYIIDADGGGLQQITSTADDVDFAPTWSPDGRQIAFVSARSDGRFVYVIDADGTGERLVNGGAGPQFAPAWQPLGDRR
jgi:Tol biopolymer transport system component